ncbi:MAG TPA: hypothetical protein VHX64_14165 [Caulobacteraceae bacterium]|nr:hypothetical protein [Caulobacteraceae bacterium]
MTEQIEEPDVEPRGGLGAAGASAAAALAIGLRRAKDQDHADPKLDAFLDEQTELIRLQKEHLHEQRLLILSRLRWGRFSDRMKALLQIMTAVVGLAVAVAIGGLAWSAAQERGLVIQSFSVPPDLAQKGLTGQVVASMLLDKLDAMQKATYSNRAASSYANNWNDEIKVEIPETGVSIGELRRLFIQWLGRQTSISGELYRTPTGLALSARAGTAAAKVHTGSEADLDAMVQQAAEDVYARTQPYRYAIYVSGNGMDSAGIARATVLLDQLGANGDHIDRIWALAALSNQLERLGNFKDALRASGRAIAIEPRFSLSYFDRSDAEGALGHDEASLADQRAGVIVMRRFGRRYLAGSDLGRLRLIDEANLESSIGDFAAATRDMSKAFGMAHAQSVEDMNLSQDQAVGHDIPAARATAADIISTAGTGSLALVEQAFADGFIAFELDDWAEATRQFRSSFNGLDSPDALPQFHEEARTLVAPYLATAMAHAGDLSGAQAMAALGPADCYACQWARGDIAALSGDARTADLGFAEAVRQGPSLPFAYVEWARAKLARGDAGGAIALAVTAAAKSPHYADASEIWGEALLKKADFAGAASRFATADADAPAWGRNHLEWGVALMLSGRYAEARRQFEAANGLELSIGDRAALKLLLARTASGPLHG